MTRYEYKEIVYTFSYDEKKQNGLTNAEILLNKAGSEGWKLAGMDRDSWDRTHFILMREKQ